MPILKLKKYERKDKFIGRCMSDKIMKKEYKNKQRLAICFDIIKGRNKK